MEKKAKYQALGCLVACIGLAIWLVGIGAGLRSILGSDPQIGEEIVTAQGLEFIGGDFGGVENIPSSVQVVRARKDRSWDHSERWAVYRIAPDQIAQFKERVRAHYAAQPERRGLVIAEGATTTQPRIVLPKGDRPDWWKATNYTDATVLAITGQGSWTYYVFTAEGRVYYHHSS